MWEIFSLTSLIFIAPMSLSELLIFVDKMASSNVDETKVLEVNFSTLLLFTFWTLTLVIVWPYSYMVFWT